MSGPIYVYIDPATCIGWIVAYIGIFVCLGACMWIERPRKTEEPRNG